MNFLTLLQRLIFILFIIFILLSAWMIHYKKPVELPCTILHVKPYDYSPNCHNVQVRLGYTMYKQDQQGILMGFPETTSLCLSQDELLKYTNLYPENSNIYCWFDPLANNPISYQKPVKMDHSYKLILKLTAVIIVLLVLVTLLRGGRIA